MKTKLFLLGFWLATIALLGSCANSDDCEDNPLGCLAFCARNPNAAECTSQALNGNLIETDSTSAVAKLPIKE